MVIPSASTRRASPKSATRGVPALREAIATYLKRTRRLEVAGEQVLVAPGCKMALSLAMMALIGTLITNLQLFFPYSAKKRHFFNKNRQFLHKNSNSRQNLKLGAKTDCIFELPVPTLL